MTDSYFLVLKTKNVFNSTVNKVIFFKSYDDAYNYGMNLDILNKKEILYTKEETLEHNILWISNTKNYPRLVCKIIPISNDLLLNLYLTWIGNEQERYLIQSIYKALKINNLLDKKRTN